jgi:cephalosporin-C deacetylase-like acetyl esterase
MNYLKAVFWDYPQFTDSSFLIKTLADKKKEGIRDWILVRFFEHGRAVDTFRYFSLSELAEKINRVKLSAYSHRKWKRLIEIYANPERE